MKTWQKLRANPKLWDRYFVKEYTFKAIRKFFEERGFHELESPIITPALPQERYLDVLETKIELQGGKSLAAFLIPSTETFNKKILAAGLGNHFVITKVFRGLEEIGPNHSPEFTMLEWYELDHSYLDLMESTELLIQSIKRYIDSQFKGTPTLEFTYRDKLIDLGSPWDRLTVREGLEKYAGITLEDIQDLAKFQKTARDKGYQIDNTDDWQTVYELIFASEVEPHFSETKPTFVYDFPRQLCPLTKVKESDPLVCEKVELYLAGKEIANGYTELRDPVEQEKRFLEEQSARQALGKKPIAFDWDFVEAIRAGLPPVAGIGLGIDRLVMILANAQDISEINYFPASEYFQ